MKRVGHITKDGQDVSLLDAMCSYDNILIAYNKAESASATAPRLCVLPEQKRKR